MISFKKTYVPTGLAHQLNFHLTNKNGEYKQLTKETLEEVEAFILIEDGVKPDLSVYDFENILVLNAVEFEELKYKESLAEVIASAEVIDLRKEGVVANG